MEPIVRAIDVGYGQTKYVVSTDRGQVKCAHFPSLAPIAAGRDLAAALGRKRKTVELAIGGVTYEIGPDAALVDDVVSTRHMDNDYVLSNEYLALVRGALHFMRADRIDLLVVGLPVSTFAMRKAALEKRLTGTHDVGERRKVVIRKVRVLAQPQGALMNYALSDAERFMQVKAQRTLIIDPGARTFDWLVGQGLKTIEKRSGSVNRGMYDVLRILAEAIGRAENTQFADYERIDQTLRNNHRLAVFQQAYDLKRHLPMAQKIVEAAVLEMKRVVQDGNDIDNILLTGGGAFFFKPVLQTMFPRHQLTELSEGLYANVIGFQRAGMESIRIDAQRTTPGGAEVQTTGGEG